MLDEKDFPQNNPWHIYDVWNHSYQDDENGIRHFRGHSQKSAEISEQILKRLGYSENEISQICFLIANHDKTIQTEVINADNLETYKKLLNIQYCDASGYNPEYIQRVYDRLDKVSSYFKGYEESNVYKKVDEVENKIVFYETT